MTPPVLPVNIPPTPVVQGGGSGFETYLPLIVRILQQSAERRTRQAELATGSLAEGTTYGSLSPDQQKQVRRATGIKDWKPEDVVRPFTGEAAELRNLMSSLGIAPESTLGQSLMSTRAGRVAGGQARPLTTAAGLEAEGQATTSAAKGRAVQAGEFQRATERMAAGTESQNLTESEVAGFRAFNDFTPSEPIAQNLTANTRAAVMREALRIAGDPDSVSWARLLPPGTKPADIIGAGGLGLLGIIQSGVDRENITAAKAREHATEALYSVAEEVSKAMGGRYSPDFIAAVMQGDPKALNSEAGAVVQRHMDAAFSVSITEMAQKGDPSFVALERLLELGRIPQIAGNEETLANYSNLFRDLISTGLTRTWLGFDRPQEGDPRRPVWDALNKSVRDQMGGMFRAGWFLDKGIKVEPIAGQEPSQNEKDRDLIMQSLQALFGDSIPTGGVPFQAFDPSNPLGRMRR